MTTPAAIALILATLILAALVFTLQRRVDRLESRITDLGGVVDIMLDSDTHQVDWNATQASFDRRQIEINARLAAHIQTVAKEVVDLEAATSDVFAIHEARLDDIQKEIE